MTKLVPSQNLVGSQTIQELMFVWDKNKLSSISCKYPRKRKNIWRGRAKRYKSYRSYQCSSAPTFVWGGNLLQNRCTSTSGLDASHREFLPSSFAIFGVPPATFTATSIRLEPMWPSLRFQCIKQSVTEKICKTLFFDMCGEGNRYSKSLSFDGRLVLAYDRPKSIFKNSRVVWRLFCSLESVFKR